MDKTQRKKDYGMLSPKWDTLPLPPRLKDHSEGDGEGVHELKVADDSKEAVFLTQQGS